VMLHMPHFGPSCIGTLGRIEPTLLAMSIKQWLLPAYA
jgi:hypothetical protein